MNCQKPSACFFALFLCAIWTNFSSAVDQLYYTEPGFDDGIRVLNKDGTGHDFAIDFGNVDPRGLAIDPVAKKFYYSRGSSIHRVNFDGTSDEFLIASGGSVPTDIELDLTSGKMYWSVNSLTGSIRRANLDGTSEELLVSQTLLDTLALSMPPVDPLIRADDVSGIELFSGRVYWANSTGLNSMPLSGVSTSTDPTHQFSLASGTGEFTKLAIDGTDSTVYWTNSSGSKVQKAAVADGSGLVTLSDRMFGRPSGIALDVPAGKVYWGDTLGTFGDGEILTLNMDGTTPVGSPDIIFSFGNGAYDPFDLEFGPAIPEPGTAGMVCVLLFSAGCFRRR